MLIASRGEEKLKRDFISISEFCPLKLFELKVYVI